MPKDYPDWFGQPQFPSYGQYKLNAIPSQIVGSGSTKTIVSMTASINIVGTYVHCYSVTRPDQVIVDVYADENLFATQVISNLRNYNLSDVTGYPLKCTYYDEVGESFFVALNVLLTVISSYQIKVENHSSVNINVSAGVYYYERA